METNCVVMATYVVVREIIFRYGKSFALYFGLKLISCFTSRIYAKWMRAHEEKNTKVLQLYKLETARKYILNR